MRNTRKGFTLVELLIVVAILATLTAAMTASITGSTAKAKAATIASNVEAMKNAASIYYADHIESKTDLDVSTTTMLLTHMPTFLDFDTGSGIRYQAAAEADVGREKWVVTVDFSRDGEADAIATELGKIKGYGTYKPTATGTAANVLSTKAFKVTLWNGKIESVTTLADNT